jgi:hypothetical protein
MMKHLQAVFALAFSLSLLAWTGTIAIAYTTAATVGAADSFDLWIDKVPTRRAEVRAFEAFLVQEGVAGVLPTREILLNDDTWSECHMDGPYSLAQPTYWPHIVGTLRYIRDEIVPTIGPVRVASGYREPAFNRCTGGAANSAHAQFYALDLTPIRNLDRGVLIARVCANHARHGGAYHIGLGFYDGTRFHIDSRSFRRWGADYHSATSPCVRAVS